jgi:hypothetical protein
VAIQKSLGGDTENSWWLYHFDAWQYREPITNRVDRLSGEGKNNSVADNANLRQFNRTYGWSSAKKIFPHEVVVVRHEDG